MENSKNNIVINIASITTISGIVLYQFGWLYWRFFFKRFNIDSSLIDMSFIKIIATTWTNILLILFFVFFASFKEIVKKEVTLMNAIIAFIISSSFMFYSLIDNKTYKMIIVGITLIIVLILSFKKHYISISRKVFMYIMIAGTYVISFFYYPVLAIENADTLYNDYSEDVTFIIKDDNTKIYGKFISHMESKYFVLVENSNCKKVVKILNDDDIISVELIKNDNVFDDLIRKIPKVDAPIPATGP
ncbi:hypothetical protein EYY60_13865 [Flavobacterium zhairuonense]|uniref:hypothetical protein n=1 Tax=Flavobacterium zhairuonense TaxID=2493631 RepID=UPI0010531BA7|nr:hypothetical protein [Flavobacterium zhairuonense]KAF2509459.1 hypothetical protein EYY60_13865 [Flavobacterium zhairuonense]